MVRLLKAKLCLGQIRLVVCGYVRPEAKFTTMQVMII